ncbi:hypothetical protein Asulf_01515 [Archaeoglobus sulfaticallidus PM70-1]|uniref:Uncharacterized protein n=1 Tax=Archaeoglobus sulfaticallidus PM70-1 TaxID=387631 RepID=N0BET1_9EURY|nr:hypothetical protein [Archaeoglobus sulfaticallidus]AGK61498.1 hypothetical protein Asulf_01515 [Archaeoglobus sulfaticallidus PM70-1]
MKLKLVNAPTYISKEFRLKKGEVVEVEDKKVAERMLETGLFEEVKEKSKK